MKKLFLLVFIVFFIVACNVSVEDTGNETDNSGSGDSGDGGSTGGGGGSTGGDSGNGGGGSGEVDGGTELKKRVGTYVGSVANPLDSSAFGTTQLLITPGDSSLTFVGGAASDVIDLNSIEMSVSAGRTTFTKRGVPLSKGSVTISLSFLNDRRVEILIIGPGYNGSGYLDKN